MSSRALLVEYDGAGARAPRAASTRGFGSGRFYVEHVEVPDPLTGICHEADEAELYDLSADPYQLQNLYRATAGPPLCSGRASTACGNAPE